MDFFSKFIFRLKKPKMIIVTGEGRACAKEAIFQVLNQHFKVEKNVLIFDLHPDESGIEKFEFLIKKSSLPVLVITHLGDIPPDKFFFAGEKEKMERIKELVKVLPSEGYLVLNFDDETVREVKEENQKIPFSHILTFGFQEGSDFRATDIKLNTGTNFKINYKGNIVPIWLEMLFGKEQIYSALSAICVGTIFGLNLVEISQALKNYYSLPGKMRLIKGMRDSWILDDSESATLFSMIEAIKILGKIELGKKGRRIAVLGDVLSIGKYTIEAHEVIGEEVAENADLLFTFGSRAKFISEGAQKKGMAPERIFQFETIEEGILKLKEEIREGDLILVDGSKEMKMKELVAKIKREEND